MNILERYCQVFDDKENNHDFVLISYSDNLYVGKDNAGHAVIVIPSNRPERMGIRQKTKMLSVECNVPVTYRLEGELHRDVVHIIRCLVETKKEEEIFVELTTLFDVPSKSVDQEESILEIVAILTEFFSNKTEPTYRELQGLFAELYTIWSYKDILNLAIFWQSRDRMKFDFSLTERDKIEVKSTIKNERRHHFKHEQLWSEIYNIHVVSYMLRADDEGLSLYELINMTKPLLRMYPQKTLIVDRYVKNTSEERLRETRYNEYLLKQCRKIYNASDIPKFTEQTPSGVSNAEYDCILDHVKSVDEELFLQNIRSINSSIEPEGELII